MRPSLQVIFAQVHLRTCQIVVVVGVMLLALSWYFDRSLWLDEASLALAIMERDYVGLLSPLDYEQVAPIGFLWIEKLMMDAFGVSGQVMRVLPLVGMLLGLYFTFLLFYRLLEDRILAWSGVALLLFNTKIFYFATEFKQYSLDLMVLAANLLLLYELEQGRVKEWQLALVAIFSLMLSHVYAFFIPLALIYGWLFGRRYLGWYAGVSLVSLAVYDALFVHGHPSKAYMLEYWHHAFLPMGRGWESWVIFFQDAVGNIYRVFLMGGRFWGMWLVAHLVSLSWMLYMRRYKLLAMSGLPWAIHLGASALSVYPFTDRFVLYLLPLFYLSLLASLMMLAELHRYWSSRAMALAVVAVSILLFAKHFTLERQEIRSAMAWVFDSDEHPDAPILVHDLDWRVVHYYAQTDGQFSHLAGRYTSFGLTDLVEQIEKSDEGVYMIIPDFWGMSYEIEDLEEAVSSVAHIHTQWEITGVKVWWVNHVRLSEPTLPHSP